MSVLLLPSPNPWCKCAVAATGGVEVPNPESPVISNLLKALTSIDAFPAIPGLVTVADAGGAAGWSSQCSIVSSVFWKGFGGAVERLLIASSSEVSEVVASKGSPSRCTGLEAWLNMESSSSTIVEGESGMEGESGGGD